MFATTVRQASRLVFIVVALIVPMAPPLPPVRCELTKATSSPVNYVVGNIIGFSLHYWWLVLVAALAVLVLAGAIARIRGVVVVFLGYLILFAVIWGIAVKTNILPAISGITAVC